MHIAEWFFPILQCIRQRQAVSRMRVVITVAVAILVQWFAANIILSLSTTAHISNYEKLIIGFEEAVTMIPHWLQNPVIDLYDETAVLAAAGMSLLPVFAAIEYAIAAFILYRSGHGGKHRQGWILLKMVLLSSQTWAIYWTAYGIGSYFVQDASLLWAYGGVFGVPVLLAVVIAIQAAKATKVLCSATPASNSGLGR